MTQFPGTIYKGLIWGWGGGGEGILWVCRHYPVSALCSRAFFLRSLKPATHLAILYADRSEFDRERILRMIDADTLGDFLRRSRRFGTSISFPGHFPRSCRHFEKSCDKIAQLDWLTLVTIRSDKRKTSRERHTWRMPANLIADI